MKYAKLHLSTIFQHMAVCSMVENNLSCHYFSTLGHWLKYDLISKDCESFPSDGCLVACVECAGRHSEVYWEKVPTSKNPIVQVSRSASTFRRKKELNRAGGNCVFIK